MRHTVRFKARGHPNIRAKHRTTFMTTIEPDLSPEGDCIIAVSADIALAHLPEVVKAAAKNPDTRITFTLRAGSHEFTAHGRGHNLLTYTDVLEMVARKSSYTCGRTLMVGSDKAAVDIPPVLLKKLQDPETEVTIEITYEYP